MLRSPLARMPSLLVALTALVFAACSPSIEASDPPALPTVASAKVAFEPVTGLPDDRTPFFAAALGRAAAEQQLNVVGRGSEEVDYRLKGYVTARSQGDVTVVSYVWDVFDRDNARLHRIEGEERLPAALPNPWQTVTDDALQALAQDTVTKLQAWLGSGAPVTTSELPAENDDVS